LKDEIDYLNITQKEFAQKTGMQPNVISEIVNAKRSITPEIAIKIESLLGINVITVNCSCAFSCSELNFNASSEA